MDPSAAWRRACDALADGNVREASLVFGEIQLWVEGGGFYPKQWASDAGAARVWLATVTSMFSE